MLVKTKVLAFRITVKCASVIKFGGSFLCANLWQVSTIKIKLEHSSEAIAFNHETT
jgi:hypothetical protein